MKPAIEPGDDAVFQAINSPKGKAVEALFSHALRSCRLSDVEKTEHVSSWAIMRGTFENELNKCRNANYEFSTLAANYIAQLMYLNRDWLRMNIGHIFPELYVKNFNSALEGLGYATASRQIYVLLAEAMVIDRALKSDFVGRHAREKMMERLALAYLWGDEELKGEKFSYLFKTICISDIKTISRFFYSVRGQEITEDQKKKIVLFWDYCVGWVATLQQVPEELLSSLSRLSCYIESVGETQAKLLLAVAPYVNVSHNADFFIEELDRLTESNPPAVSAVFKKVIEFHVPVYDYQDRLKSLLIKLNTNGRREDVLSYLERIRSNLPDLASQLFKQLTRSEVYISS
jgi:hypothetical protein